MAEFREPLLSDEYFVFAIDSDQTKNYDDALHCRDLGNGVYEVGVHIADVAYHVGYYDAH